MYKECRMADRGPQKAGAYERPARMKGMIIGIVVLIALIILAILFFPDGVREPPRSGREVGMQSMNSTAVRGKDGWCGTVLPPIAGSRSDPTHVRVQLESGSIPRARGGRDPTAGWQCLRALACGRAGARAGEEPAETNLSRWCPCSRKSWRCRSAWSRRGKVRLTKVVHEREVHVR